MEFTGEGAEDPGHHDAVLSSRIDGWISDIGEDVIIEGIAMKREKHKVMPPLVVWRRGFQNDHGHRSYVMEASSLHMQVRGEGSIGVGAGIGRAIIIIILGDRYPLGSGELLFQVMGDGLLLLPSEGGGMLARPCHIQGLVCGSHGGDESLLLSVRGSGGGLSCDHNIALLWQRQRPVAHR
jgi:hypothetical protein